MGEAEVELIARKTVDAYDEKVGTPRHRQNTKKIDRLTWICGIGLGVVGTLQALMSAGVIHVAAR